MATGQGQRLGMAWQVHVEHPDTDAVLVVRADSEADALLAGEMRAVDEIGPGAVATWACAR